MWPQPPPEASPCDSPSLRLQPGEAPLAPSNMLSGTPFALPPTLRPYCLLGNSNFSFRWQRKCHLKFGWSTEYGQRSRFWLERQAEPKSLTARLGNLDSVNR